MPLTGAERTRRWRERQRARAAADKPAPERSNRGGRLEGHGSVLLDLDRAKCRKVQAEAERAELELQARRGDLVDRKAAAADWIRAMMPFRDALEVLPSRVQLRLAGANALNDAQLAALRDELRTVSRALSDANAKAPTA